MASTPFSLVSPAKIWFIGPMLYTVGLLLLCVLWGLLCMRIYALISRENTLQRRLIAIGAGLGAGLIYVVGSILISLVKAPSFVDLPPPVEKVEAVKISPKAK
ncbi:MAG TPA: hypothetical protein DCP71_02600 [Verrucomicrobiales bacterium]|nr:hypothetical protein [Verrucomicrobiales bacterium]